MCTSLPSRRRGATVCVAVAESGLFVRDGVFLPSNGSPIVQGRDAIERSWAELFKNVGGDETITVKYAIPAGNDAVVAINEFKIVGDGENSNKIISGRASITLVPSCINRRT
jgi:ketosteroid isomerase-like protein